MKKIIVDYNNANQRLDKFIFKFFQRNIPKSLLYKLLRTKKIKLNSKKAVGNEVLNEHDEVLIFLCDDTIIKFSIPESKRLLKTNFSKPESNRLFKMDFENAHESCVSETEHSKLKLKILYEDENILVCDKPVGILSQPSSKSDTNTMVHLLHDYLPRDFLFSPAFCNRLDRNTTGIMIAGKNFRAMQELNLSIKSIHKYYLAIVYGKIDTSGTLHGSWSKDYKTNKVSVDAIEGKEVLTYYTPIVWTNEFTFLKLKLITGKSHQIRASLSQINHPIVGDNKYGKDNGLQLLHAYQVEFTKPNGLLSYLCGKKIISVPNKIFKSKFENMFDENLEIIIQRI